MNDIMMCIHRYHDVRSGYYDVCQAYIDIMMCVKVYIDIMMCVQSIMMCIQGNMMCVKVDIDIMMGICVMTCDVSEEFHNA